MPRAILEFKLPEETEDHEVAVNGGKWKSLAWNLDQWLREQIKYSEKDEFQPVRDKLHELAQDQGLTID